MRTLHEAIEHCVQLNDSGIDAIINEAMTLDERLRQQQMALRDGAFVDRTALDAAIAERDATRDKLLRQTDVVEEAFDKSKFVIAALRYGIKKLVCV